MRETEVPGAIRRARDRIAVGPAPVSEIVRRGQRAQRKSRIAQVVTAAAAVVIVLSGAVVIPRVWDGDGVTPADGAQDGGPSGPSLVEPVLKDPHGALGSLVVRFKYVERTSVYAEGARHYLEVLSQSNGVVMRRDEGTEQGPGAGYVDSVRLPPGQYTVQTYQRGCDYQHGNCEDTYPPRTDQCSTPVSVAPRARTTVIIKMRLPHPCSVNVQTMSTLDRRAIDVYTAAISEFVTEFPKIMQESPDVAVVPIAMEKAGWSYGSGASRTAIPESVQRAVTSRVTGVKSLTWVTGQDCFSVDADLLITLDRLNDASEPLEVSVSAAYEASGSCEGWLVTYLVARTDDGWAVIGETAPTGLT